MEFRILYIAELVGKMGVFSLKKKLPELKQQFSPDIVIANADGVTGGAGIGKNHAIYLRKLGVQLITCGDNIYLKKDMVEAFPVFSHVLRPANLSIESPGRGWKCIATNKGKVAVISLLGQTGFSRIHSDNPFVRIPFILEAVKKEASCIIIDYHGATTAEKQAFAFYMDGKVSAVIGSHGRVQTADERILEKGTGFITDAGRTGSSYSVGGFDAQSRIRYYITGIPEWNKESEESPEIQGVFLTTNIEGICTSIERVKIPLGEL